MAIFYLRVYDVRVRLANDGTIKSQIENADPILILKVRVKVTGATCENVFVEPKQ
jgi:hypothetical protein